MDDIKKIIAEIYFMVNYVKTGGKKDKITKDDFEIKNNLDNIYEILDTFENYILNFNTYVYDILSQEIFIKMFKERKVVGLEEILENNFEQLKKLTDNKKILEKMEYIKNNTYKINSLKKFRKLIDLIKSLKIKDTEELEKLYFATDKLYKVKNNKFTKQDIYDIIDFAKKHDISRLNTISKDIDEILEDYDNIIYLYREYRDLIEKIKSRKYIDRIIAYLDSIKN